MSEREPTQPTPVLDAERVAQALGAELRRGSTSEPELTLEDEASGLEVRLTLHQNRDAVSFYVRVGRHFGGFLHLAGVDRVELKREQREVHFIATLGGSLCRFAVTGRGQILALANVSEEVTQREVRQAAE